MSGVCPPPVIFARSGSVRNNSLSIIVGSTAAGSDSPSPSAVNVSGSPNDPGSFFDIIPLDTLGRATFWVRFGRKAGAAQVTVSGLGSNQRVSSAPGRKYMAGLDWSPDGRWLVVRSGELPRVELIRVDTGETLPLPFSALVEEPAWRPATR